jgi:hypothetical protein
MTNIHLKRENEKPFFFFPQVESPILKNKEKRRIK